jgi:hypothetical protein
LTGAGAALDVAAVSIVAIMAPIETSSPSGVMIFKRPAAGASSSFETLSVSRVTRSIRKNLSLCHQIRAIVDSFEIEFG